MPSTEDFTGGGQARRLEGAALEQQVRQRTGELRALTRALSHDLRNPIVAVGGFANLLRRRLDPERDPKALEYVDRIQESAEWMQSLLTCALAGTNLIHDLGYAGSGLAGSPEALVICDEIAGLVKRLLDGFPLDAEALALDEIDRVGPGAPFTMMAVVNCVIAALALRLILTGRSRPSDA